MMAQLLSKNTFVEPWPVLDLRGYNDDWSVHALCVVVEPYYGKWQGVCCERYTLSFNEAA
jgi:hypothetical protein